MSRSNGVSVRFSCALLLADLVGGACSGGVIAYYPFNGNANDESGNGHDGIVTGAVLTSDRLGNPASAYLFDGEDDFVDLGDSAAFRPTAAITVEAWAYKDDWHPGGSDEKVISNTESGGWAIEVEPGSSDILGFLRRNGVYANPDSSLEEIPPGWHHIAMTYDGRYTKLYLDGRLVATNDAGADFPIQYSRENHTFIGAEAGGGTTPTGSEFTGVIDEVRIHDEALSSADILQSSGFPGGGLVAHYPFSGNAHDASGNGYDGIVYGAVLTTDRFGVEDEAYVYDGYTDYTDLGGTPAFRPTAGLTVEVWAHRDDWTTFSGDEQLIGNTHSGGWGLEFDEASGDLLAEVRRDGVYEAATIPFSGLLPGWHQLPTAHTSSTATPTTFSYRSR